MSKPSPEDIRGETAAGREAYNQRRRYLISEGIGTIPDLYDDDLNGAYADEGTAFEYSAARYWEQIAAKAAKDAAQERAWGIADAHANDKYPTSD